MNEYIYEHLTLHHFISLNAVFAYKITHFRGKLQRLSSEDFLSVISRIFIMQSTDVLALFSGKINTREKNLSLFVKNMYFTNRKCVAYDFS